MITEFYYDEQIRKWQIQFCSIFAGMKVMTGNGVCGEKEFMTVPIRIGSRDRVVAFLESGNTQNKPMSLPMMVANMTGISLNDSRRKGIMTVDRRTILPYGGVFPDDLTTVVRVMPIPYDLNMDLSIYASNTQQSHMIMEQIMMLFDPCLQLQSSDAAMDWTKLTQVTMTGIDNEENYPMGTDRRVIVWTFSFELPIWIASPVDFRDQSVKQVTIRLGDLGGWVPDEFDDNGDLQPFLPGAQYGDAIVVNGTPAS